RSVSPFRKKLIGRKQKSSVEWRSQRKSFARLYLLYPLARIAFFHSLPLLSVLRGCLYPLIPYINVAVAKAVHPTAGRIWTEAHAFSGQPIVFLTCPCIALRDDSRDIESNCSLPLSLFQFVIKIRALVILDR